jgi:hypothetical protein
LWHSQILHTGLGVEVGVLGVGVRLEGGVLVGVFGVGVSVGIAGVFVVFGVGT